MEAASISATPEVTDREVEGQYLGRGSTGVGSTGISSESKVPLPAGLVISSRPPNASMRSASPTRPVPWLGSAPRSRRRGPITASLSPACQVRS